MQIGFARLFHLGSHCKALFIARDGKYRDIFENIENIGYF